MQRANERGRMTTVGKRTDDGSQCTLLAVHETRGRWCLYPHGADQLGVRLTHTEAARLAQAILAGCELDDGH